MATVDELLKAQNTSNATSGNSNVANPSPATPTATEGENRINAMFDAQKQNQLNQLETAYNQSLSAQQAARDKIAPQYQTAANDLAVQYERNRRNFNQQAAARGLNTGTASQAALAQNNEYLRDFGKLRASEGEALANADRGIADLTTNYQGSISAAVADNDYKRAAALLDQYNADRKEALSKAEVLASYGDFSGFADIYGSATANKMKKSWIASNPAMAFMTGAINENQYNNLINGYPMNYVGADGGGSGGGSGGSPWDYGGAGYNPGYQLEIDGLSPNAWLDRENAIANLG